MKLKSFVVFASPYDKWKLDDTLESDGGVAAMKLIINIFSPLKAKVSCDKNFDENYSKKNVIEKPFSISISLLCVSSFLCVALSSWR